MPIFQHERPVSPPLIFWCLMVSAAVMRAYMVQLDFNVLLGQGLIQDDAFYYYEIARFLNATGVPSFDGINPTNGFHPLWQALCLPVFSLWQGELPLHVMLGLASLFDLASLYLVFQILHQLTRSIWAPLCGVAIWGLHGTIIRTWFNGLETALHIFTLLFFLFIYLKVRAATQTTWRDHTILGFLAAGAFLARTDSAIIIFVMFGFLYLPQLFNREIKPGLIAAIICMVFILPWLLWNYLTFGNIVQVSGQVKYGAWLVGGAPPDHGFLQEMLLGIWASFNPICILFEKMFYPLLFKIPIPGYLVMVIFLGGSSYLYRKDGLVKEWLNKLAPFILGALCLFLYHAGFRHFVRGWYNAPLLLCFVLITCLLFERLFFKHSQKKSALVLMIIIIVLITLYSPVTYIWQRSPQDPRVAAALWINQHTETAAKIGAANAGIVGYYADRPVINLDGVVNEGAYKARIADKLHRYIFESGINYLADHKGSMVHLCADNMFYHCEKVATWGNTIVARVIPSAD